MRLGWVAMLCHVYELRHETSVMGHVYEHVRLGWGAMRVRAET